MNRRQWIQRVSAGVVGACVATKLPTAWLPEVVRSYAAHEFLRRHVNDWAARYGNNHRPKVIVADAALYDAYESELVTNFRMVTYQTLGPRGGERMLMFRDIPVHRSAIASDSGWRCVLVAGENEEAA